MFCKAARMSLGSDSFPAPRPGSLSAVEASHLQETLKRCSPETLAAACAYRMTGDIDQLRLLIAGVIERYVERELRPKLRHADDSLRLVEDLGIDSLTMMEIVCLTEDVLRINVTNEELIRLRTLGEIRAFLAAKAGTAGLSSIK